jgi:hypothetical protein
LLRALEEGHIDPIRMASFQHIKASLDDFTTHN